MLDSYTNLLSCLKLRHSVHPQQPVEPKHSEFFEVTSRRRLRIIHIKPNKTELNNLKDNNGINEKTPNDNRVSGEYWFTCWNKPIQNTTCNCSFRKSKKNFTVDKRNRYSCMSNSSINDKLEMFVEKLITNAMLIAYQEYLKTSNIISNKKNLRSKKGIINLSFDNDNEKKTVKKEKALNSNLRKCKTHTKETTKVRIINNSQFFLLSFIFFLAKTDSIITAWYW